LFITVTVAMHIKTPAITTSQKYIFIIQRDQIYMINNNMHRTLYGGQY